MKKLGILGHYENAPIQTYLKFDHQNMKKIYIKILIQCIFHISAQNIDCGYSLEPPWRGGSGVYPQSMFLIRNKNKKSAESDVAPAWIKSYKFLFVLKKIYFAVLKKLMG